MSDIQILPNPFKMLDLEREKRMKATGNKCNKCVDTKKEGFNNTKKDKSTIEGNAGMNTTVHKWRFVGTLSAASFIVLVLGVKFHIALQSKSDIAKNILNLALFITFAFISLILHTNNFTFPGKFINNAFFGGEWEIEDKFAVKNKKMNNPWIWSPIIVGFVMFVLRFLTEMIGYFENTVGYFIYWIYTWRHGGLNKWMRSDNFAALTRDHDEVTINFNPLMSLFNLENYGKKIKSMRIDNDDNLSDKNNSSDFFVSLKHRDGTKTENDFKDYIYNNVILKRVSGEVTLLVITTLLSAGILKSIYN
jgi:hypothetical protein